MFRKRFAVAMGFSLALLLSGSAAALQEASPAASPAGPPLPAGCTVVASGLVNPRYVTVGDDGTLYISEAGVGGDQVATPPVVPGATPETGPGGEPLSVAIGDTGQVSMVAPDGTQSVLVDGLPSFALSPIESVGPAGIAFANGQVLLAVGGPGPATAFTDPIPNESSIVSIDPASGEVTLVADLGAYERTNNPDGFAIDSNVYGIGVADDGTIYANDAGANATYRIAPGGEPEVLVVHAGLPLPEGMEAPPGGNPGRGGANELDPVPTDIEFGADSSVLVGLLSGGPFPPGAAKVVSVAQDGTVADLATGLTMVVALAVGPDDQLYATQISTNFLGEMPEPGNVVRLLADGTQEVVADGLILPNGIAFDQDGNLLVVVNSVSMGGPDGQVLRCEGIAASAASPAQEVTIELSEMMYTPSEVTIAADTDVTLRLVNNGVASHDFSISALGINSGMVAAGEEVTLSVNVPAGDYAFGCDVPGHRLAGMNGVLRVV